MSEALSAQAWMDCVLSAVNEVAEMTFESPANDVKDIESIPEGREGSIMALNRGDESLQLGVLSDKAGCVALTRALLQMEEDEEVAEEDVTDAVGEIVNILGGVVQRALDGQGDAVTLGFPIFIRGQIYPPNKSEARYVTLNLGPAQADLLVLRGELPKSK